MSVHQLKNFYRAKVNVSTSVKVLWCPNQMSVHHLKNFYGAKVNVSTSVKWIRASKQLLMSSFCDLFYYHSIDFEYLESFSRTKIKKNK